MMYEKAIKGEEDDLFIAVCHFQFLVDIVSCIKAQQGPHLVVCPSCVHFLDCSSKHIGSKLLSKRNGKNKK